MVFQSYALYPHMTVFENMAFALRGGAARRRDRARASARPRRCWGSTALLARRPRGTLGRAAAARGAGARVVRKPRVFLFDEPLSNLDAKLRVQMRAEIKRLHQTCAATMIYVTHDQAEAMTLGDRIAVLDHGALQQVADPYTLYRRPSRLFVASFIGAPPMNFFTASVDRDSGRSRRRACRLTRTARQRRRWRPRGAAISRWACAPRTCGSRRAGPAA